MVAGYLGSLGVMPPSFSADQQAALYLSMATVLLVGTWLLLLLTGTSFDSRGLAKVAHFLSYIFRRDNPDWWFFLVLAVLPFLSATSAVAYFRGVARTRRGAVVLLLGSALLAMAALVAPGSVLSVLSLVMLPALYFGYRCLRAA